jgi:hypothetical protein
MSYVLENLAVTMLVAASALFATWRLLSARLRLRVLDILEPALGTLAGAALRRLRTRTLALLAGGCGACGAKPTHLRVVKH